MLHFTVPPEWGVAGPIDFLGSSLLTENNVLTSHGVCLVSAILTFIFFLALYKTSRYWSPVVIGRTYRDLPLNEQRDWDVRWGNMVYPPLVVGLSIFDKLYNTDPVPEGKTLFTTSDLSYAALGASVGFFIVDLSVVVKYKLGGPEMAAHHLMSSFSFLWGIYTGECHVLAMWLLLTEVTTPFITMRWWLDKSMLKSTTLYMLNGFGILFSWFFFRVVMFVPFYIAIYRARYEVLQLSSVSIFLMIIVPPGLTFLNLFWFTKIVRGAIKLLTRGPPSKRQRLPAKQQ